MTKRSWDNFFTASDFCEKTEEAEKDCPHGVGNDWCGGTWNAGRTKKKKR